MHIEAHGSALPLGEVPYGTCILYPSREGQTCVGIAVRAPNQSSVSRWVAGLSPDAILLTGGHILSPVLTIPNAGIELSNDPADFVLGAYGRRPQSGVLLKSGDELQVCVAHDATTAFVDLAAGTIDFDFEDSGRFIWCRRWRVVTKGAGDARVLCSIDISNEKS